MSTNPVARPQSRRGILTAALAGAAAGAATFAGRVAIAATATPEPVEAGFVRWITRTGKVHKAEDATDADLAAASDLINDVVACAPSAQKAAAFVLHELCYAIDEEGMLSSMAVLIKRDHIFRLHGRVLESLRPELSGRLAELVADLLDNPERDARRSRLFLAYTGEVSL